MSDASTRTSTESRRKKIPALNGQGPLPSFAAQRQPDMSAEVSGLDVWVERNMNPLPTGFYHLMDARAGEFIAEQLLGDRFGNDALEASFTELSRPWGERMDPVSFVQVCVRNSSKKPRRLVIRGYLEGLSDEAVETIEIPSKRWAVVEVKPTLKNECVERMEQTRQASLQIVLQRKNGTIEGHKTFRVTCLPRNTAVFEMHGGGHKIDLSWCYGAWVTPHDDSVQDQIRRAIGEANPMGMSGYQIPNLVDCQVAALFRSVQQLGIKYVSTILNYGLPEGTGHSTRIRLPSESLEQRSANCMDATLLLASLLEGVTLNPAIVLVPRHAMLAWERVPNSKGPRSPENWGVLDANGIGLPVTFKQACDRGLKILHHHIRLDKANKTQTVKVWPLDQLRRRGVWPLH